MSRAGQGSGSPARGSGASGHSERWWGWAPGLLDSFPSIGEGSGAQQLEQGGRARSSDTGFLPCPRALRGGLTPSSPGHDCSLRLWHLDNKTCVQEITAHRKKHEEAIHAVAFHPCKALSASAGADALAKVFV